MIINVSERLKQDVLLGINDMTDEVMAFKAMRAFYTILANDGNKRFPIEHRLKLKNLYENKADMESILETYNSAGIELTPDFKFVHTDIIGTRVRALASEMTKRQISYNIKSYMPTANSERMKLKMEQYKEAISQFMQNKDQDPAQLQIELDKIKNSNPTILAEGLAGKLIKSWEETNDPTDLMYEAMGVFSITGDPIFRINDDTTVELCDPYSTFVSIPDNQNNLEMADVLEINYLTIDEILGYYGDKIPDHLEFINNYSNKVEGYSSLRNLEGHVSPLYMDNGKLFGLPDLKTGSSFLNWYNSDRIRVSRVTYRGIKKMGSLITIEGGREVTRIVSEFYKPDRSKGERIKYIGVPKYYTALIIGENDFYDMHSVDRISISKAGRIINVSGYVGRLSAYKSGRCNSIVNMAKKISEMYDVIYSKIQELVVLNQGKLVVLDTAKKPKAFTTTADWIKHMRSKHVLVKDSFNEAARGAAKGQLAIGVNTEGNSIDMDTTNNILGLINLLSFLEQRVESLTAVSGSRLGSMTNTDQVGLAQQSMNQSQISTEYMFYIIFSIYNDMQNNIYQIKKEDVRNGKSLNGIVNSDIDWVSKFVDKLDTLIYVKFNNNAVDLAISSQIDSMVMNWMLSSQIDGVVAVQVVSSKSLDDKLRILKEYKESIALNQQQQSKAMAEEAQKERAALIEQIVNQSILDKDNRIAILEEEASAKMKLMEKELASKEKELIALLQSNKEIQESKNKTVLEKAKLDSVKTAKN